MEPKICSLRSQYTASSSYPKLGEYSPNPPILYMSCPFLIYPPFKFFFTKIILSYLAYVLQSQSISCFFSELQPTGCEASHYAFCQCHPLLPLRLKSSRIREGNFISSYFKALSELLHLSGRVWSWYRNSSAGSLLSSSCTSSRFLYSAVTLYVSFAENRT